MTAAAVGGAVPLFLASRSPRRRQLLARLGVDFEPLSVAVDETARAGERGCGYVARMAREKSAADRDWVCAHRTAPPAGFAVIGSDTVVVVGGRIFGKPAGRAQAMEQLEALSGRSHEVLTAVAVLFEGPRGVAPRMREVLSRSRVWFRVLSREERQWYWETGEPADKAGSYAVQGLGARYISRIEGSYSGIMGLPLDEMAALLDLGADDHSR